jgi:hypothetical protein
LNRNWTGKLAQPGYIAAQYQPGGLVFVSMNPGAGPQSWLGVDDQRQYAALQRLRDSDQTSARSAFDELMDVLASLMPTWEIRRNFVAPVLRAAELDFSDVAYVNLLKCGRRAAADSPGCTNSAGAHTREQIELLAPGGVMQLARTRAAPSGVTASCLLSSISSRAP